MDILPHIYPHPIVLSSNLFLFQHFEYLGNIVKDETWSIVSTIAGYLHQSVKCG